ncbi:hypothetical protein GEU84_007085 [Fertoebacter nigrum]|uniref:Uncharacterized protein n=1 Tax=Fertoeibacter niger TaxID=2656921 RepID=A0A8X8GZJ3_9RHOB|nr:hypothetical protein [Fertoeibacter niger]NUB44140.1 hypothetical protein [Fertoeibacter niger]
MQDHVEQIFGRYLRLTYDGQPLTSDGLPLHHSSSAMKLVRSLVNSDPAGCADEIIKLMKPFCIRFDVDQVRGQLVALRGNRQGVAQVALDVMRGSASASAPDRQSTISTSKTKTVRSGATQ